MSLQRRHFNQALAALLGSAAGLARAQSGNLPRILVGFPAGGSIDTTARRLAEAWRGRMAESVLVEQKVGAGGRLAVAALKDSAPDGLTMLLSPSSMFTIYPHVFRKLQYNAATDAIPVTAVALSTCGFGVGPKVPDSVKTLQQFAAWAKVNVKDSAYASPAAGAMPHFLGNQFERAAGISMTHVPYRGAAPGMQDLMGGQIAAGCFSLSDFVPHLASGRVRLLGVTDTKRSRFAPDTPTFEEQASRASLVSRAMASTCRHAPARPPLTASTTWPAWHCAKRPSPRGWPSWASRRWAIRRSCLPASCSRSARAGSPSSRPRASLPTIDGRSMKQAVHAGHRVAGRGQLGLQPVQIEMQMLQQFRRRLLQRRTR